MSKLLTALPPDVVRKLCQHLNVEGAGVRNWRDLITKVQGKVWPINFRTRLHYHDCHVVFLPTDHPYDIFASDAFARNGLRPYTSPADQVIADFVARGITVDQLYSMLADMDAGGCMAVIESHGKPCVYRTLVDLYTDTYHQVE